MFRCLFLKVATWLQCRLKPLQMQKYVFFCNTKKIVHKTTFFSRLAGAIDWNSHSQDFRVNVFWMFEILLSSNPAFRFFCATGFNHAKFCISLNLTNFAKSRKSFLSERLPATRKIEKIRGKTGSEPLLLFIQRTLRNKCTKNFQTTLSCL